MAKPEPLASIASRLSAVPTCTAIDVLMKDHPVETYILQGVSGIQFHEQCVAGPARTLRYLPARADLAEATPPLLNFRLIDSVRPGEILVFDTTRGQGGSVLGDMLALRAKRRGAAAVVTDGAVRDLAGLAGTGLPVFASRVYPMPFRGSLIPHEIDVPVQCGGALVLPGDWILADRDCVLAMPRSVVDVMLDRAQNYLDEENFSKQLLDRGDALAHSYPIPEALRPSYSRYLASGELPPPGETPAVAGSRAI
jgi:regulator of RNase E activity RraA